MTSLDHVSIGVGDIVRSRKFYDATLKPLGLSCLSHDDNSLGYGVDRVFFWVSLVENPVLPDSKSGLHFCFTASTREAVVEFHQAALREGGNDNGKPGLRADYGTNYYAGFVIDPDGYRIEAYCGSND